MVSEWRPPVAEGQIHDGLVGVNVEIQITFHAQGALAQIGGNAKLIAQGVVGFLVERCRLAVGQAAVIHTGHEAQAAVLHLRFEGERFVDGVEHIGERKFRLGFVSVDLCVCVGGGHQEGIEIEIYTPGIFFVFVRCHFKFNLFGLTEHQRRGEVCGTRLFS